jgi:hypothetical protein
MTRTLVNNILIIASDLSLGLELGFSTLLRGSESTRCIQQLIQSNYGNNT